jgi:hypothetical protein
MNDRQLPRYLAIMVLPAIAVWAVVSGGAIGMSPDSLFYWSAARTIHQTGSLATQVSPRDYARTVGDDRMPSDSGVVSADGSIVYPLTTWPPGYPLAIAALMPLTRGSAIAAARLLSVITLVLLIGAFVGVAAQLVDPWRAAVASALVACLPFVQSTVRMMWSDALFAALALVALALAARSLGPTQRPGRALALAATVAALATYVRYTGPLVMAAAILVVGVMALKDPGRRVLLVKATLTIGLYTLLVAPLFMRNIQLTGHLTGGGRSPAEESLPHLLKQLLVAFARGFVPWSGGSAGPPHSRWSGGVSLAVWAVAGAAVAIAIWRSGGLRPAPRPELVRRPMGLILGAFAALYSTVLLALRTAWHFDFNTRMLLPAVASMALLVVCAFERRITDRQLWRVNAIALVTTALATLTTMAAVDRSVSWRGYNDSDFRERPVARWARAARAHPGTGSVRFLSAGYMIPYLHFATGGAPVAGLPDVPDSSAFFARSPAIATVVILEPQARRFPCPEYQRAYERVLDVAADSTFKGEGFTAWWLSARSAAGRLERGTRDRTPFRCTDRH